MASILSPPVGEVLQRDPIGYEGGVNLFEYVWDSPTNHTDPSGLQGLPPGVPWPIPSPQGLPSPMLTGPKLKTWCRWRMGCWNPWSEECQTTWGRLRKGCIGVVEAYLRVDRPWSDPSTKCFFVEGDASAAFEFAFKYARGLDCPHNRRPMIWAVNFFGASNGNSWGNCDAATGECELNGMPIIPQPGSPGGTIAFDYAIFDPPGLSYRDCWLGASTGAITGDGSIICWKDIDSFATAYSNFDTTVVCATCPK